MGSSLIRKAVRADIPFIVNMAEKFWQFTIYDDLFCPATIETLAENCIENNMCSVVDVRGVVVGFAAGVIGGLIGNASVKTGTELAWWVDPEHRGGRNGIGLLMHIEALAEAQGVKYWNMEFMESSMPEEIRAIYERLGYRKNETLYTKILS